MTPLFLAVLGFRAAALSYDVNPQRGWLATLRRAENIAWRVLSARVRVSRASASEPAVKNGVYHKTVVTSPLGILWP